MAASTRADIRVGDMTIRYLVEGNQSAGAVAIFEFDVPRLVIRNDAPSGKGLTSLSTAGLLTFVPY